MPPLLPLPCFAQRNFLTPPLPGMTFLVSGCSSSKLCKPEYSSSVKYFSISLVNIVVSINIIALIIRHCRIITSRKFIGERLDKLRPGLWQLLTITGTFVNGNSFRTTSITGRPLHFIVEQSRGSLATPSVSEKNVRFQIVDTLAHSSAITQPSSCRHEFPRRIRVIPLRSKWRSMGKTGFPRRLD